MHPKRTPQYLRQTLTDIKEEIDSNTKIVGDFNTTLTPKDRSSKQKMNNETQSLNDTLDEMDLIDIFRHSIQTQKNIPSSQVHMEHSPGEPTSWVTHQTSENLRKLKSYLASSLTTTL